MTLEEYKEVLDTNAAELNFSDTMAIIDSLYNFTPTEFKNGEVLNEANQNNGSCKLFAFAKLQNFTVGQTLNSFGEYFRLDVLNHPQGTDHQNIRNFMKTGWKGVEFKSDALTLK